MSLANIMRQEKAELWISPFEGINHFLHKGYRVFLQKV